LTKITGQPIDAPADPTPGVQWKSATAAGDLPREDRRILAAAKLAGFLRLQEQSLPSPITPALHAEEIIITDFEKRGLFLVNAAGAFLWWGEAPGEESPGRRKAEEKWAILCKSAERNEPRPLPEGDFWAFSQSELVHVCPHPDRKHLGRPLREPERPGDSSREPG
jgi:hypothetical protein